MRRGAFVAKCLKAIAKNVELGLKKTGLSASDLARKVGVTPTSISQLRHGTNANPTIGLLEAVANALGICLGELVTDPKEWKALKTHSVTDCLEVVRDALSLLKTGTVEEALAFLRDEKK